MTSHHYALELRLENVYLRKRAIDAEAELCAASERIAELEEEVELLRRDRERVEMAYVVVHPDAVVAADAPKPLLLLPPGRAYTAPERVSVVRLGDPETKTRRTE